MMWIVRLALRRTYTFVVMALLIVAVSLVAINRMSHGHLPGDQHPGRQRRLAVHRHAGRRDRAAHHPHQRARADDLGQRHRAHRKPVAVRRRRHPHLFLSARQDRGGRRPGDGHEPGDPEGHAARHRPAVHRPVQRHQRPDRADRRQQRHADRAADLRLRRQLHHPAARRRAGGARAPTVGRQVAAGDGRSRPRRSSTPAACRPRTCRPPSTTRT